MPEHIDVEEWNRLYPIGTPVQYWPGQVGDESGRCSRTRSAAWLLGGHTPVVSVEGYSGGIALSHVRPLEMQPLSSQQEQHAAELAQLVQAMRPIHLEIGPGEAMVLVGQLQLALRHPLNVGHSAQQARAIAASLQAAFPERARELLDQGWNEEYDAKAAAVKWTEGESSAGPGGHENDPLIDAVREMRAAQQQYFRKRIRDNLLAAKRAEAKVDGMLQHFAKDADHED